VAVTTSVGTIDFDTISLQRGEIITACLCTNAKDYSPLVRVAAIQALGALGGRQFSNSVLQLHPTRLLPFLYGMLADRDSMVRVSAADHIAALWKEGGELLLVEGLLKDSSPLVRGASAHGLAVLGPRSARSLLMALSDEDNNVKETAAQALLNIGLQSIAEDLHLQPRHYLDSIILFCDGILQSKSYSNGTKSRRPPTPTHDHLRCAHEKSTPSHGSHGKPAQTQDFRRFLESLRAHVVTIAKFK